MFANHFHPLRRKDDIKDRDMKKNCKEDTLFIADMIRHDRNSNQ